MEDQMTLSDLKPGSRAIITGVRGQGALRRRLLEMGLSRGTSIEVIRVAPMGDPVEYRLRGYNLSLGKAEASLIEVSL